MASKSEALSTKEIEELLDAVDQTLERLKTLYEQYFMGIQKQAPTFIHNDVERKLRDLTQLNIRNTGLRYRLATLQQKFGSYNSYWRRTLRQIENGTYLRQLAKVGRDAAKNGADIPEEILAAMPKRMREQVLRDRDQAIAIAKRRNQVEEGAAEAVHDGGAAVPDAPSAPRKEQKTQSGAHILDDDGDLDFDQLFAAFEDDAPKATPPPKAEPAPIPAHARIEPAPTQAITMPVPRFKPPATPSPEAQTTVLPRMPTPPLGVTSRPSPDTEQQTTAIPKIPVPSFAPSQQTKPNPIAPGSAAATRAMPVESMAGPFPRDPQSSTPASPSAPTQRMPTPAPGTQRMPTPPPGTPLPTQRMPTPPTGTPPPPGATQRMPTPPPGTQRMPTPAPGTQRMPTPAPGQRAPTPPAPLKPPPGMTEADVNALHAKYVQAKQAVGEKVDASSREKLLRTINQTAPKVMEQYKSAGVDFTVVVKDNQVVIKAKPKG